MKKRHVFGRALKQLFLAVPASALMLGSSHAGSSVGINFQGSYGGSYAGSPVTVTAFGLPATAWFTADSSTAYSGSMPVSPGSGGSLTVNWNSADTWCSGLDPEILYNGTNYSTPGPTPGDAQVLWGYLDDPSPGASVSVSGLNSTFPNGYVIQTVAAEVYVVAFSDSIISDGTTNENLPYTYYWYPINFFGPPFNNTGTAGLSAQSGVFTNDTIDILGGTPAGGTRAPLCGFIITDMPVVSQSPVDSTNDLEAPFTLSAVAIGIPPLSYQWQLNGANVPGATAAIYTNADATLADAGDYALVVTNAYGSTTSQVASVTILQAPSIAVDLPPALTNYSTMNATFSVLAGGAQPLAYTWSMNGSVLSATNSSLLLTNLQTTDAGSYQVIVSNSSGSVTSGVAILTVLSSAPPYEGFAYSAGDLAGQTGGVGWNSPWTEETSAVIDGGTVNGDHAVIPAVTPWIGGVSQLTSSGGSLELAALGGADYDNIRSLMTTLGGNGSGTIYLSFVAQVTNTTWGGIELVQDGAISIFLGSCWEGANWGWGTRAAPAAASSVSPFTYSLLVYRFDFTPTNTAIRLYVNPSSLSSEPSVASVSGTQSSLLTFDEMRIATHGYLGTGAGPDGVLDEIRIGGTWDAVTPHSLPTNAPFSLQLVPGGVIEDTKPVGTPHPGLSYNTTWTNSSTDNNSVTRTGVEQFSAANGGQITVPANTDFDSTTGTICFWMLYDDLTGLPGPGNEAAMLFDRRTTNGTIIGLNLDGDIEVQVLGGVNYFVGSKYVVDGNWHQVTLTYDQSSNGLVSLYVDGNLDTSQANTNVWYWPDTQEIELGRSHDPYWYIYDGQMDDFRMYNTILTPTEIATIAAPATSDMLEETNALQVRFNFDSATYGYSLVWPFGTLESSPALGTGAAWTPLTNAVSPMPLLTTNPATFYRLYGTP
jgi:Concanavalin A-like lectin/glucanases superfamily